MYIHTSVEIMQTGVRMYSWPGNVPEFAIQPPPSYRMSTDIRSKRVIRSHTKSRMGCTHCKKRRVKCDEVRPICGTCERRKTECIYENYKRETSNARTDPDAQFPTVPLCGEREKQIIQSQPKLPPFSYLDIDSLKLFYHWTHVTSKTFSHTDFAQRALPEIGFCNPALMHAILALSAMHLHHIHGPQYRNGDTDYLTLAMSHKNRISPLLTQVADRDVYMMALAFLHVLNYADPQPNTFDMFSIVGSIYEIIDGKVLENPVLTASISWKPGQPWATGGSVARGHIRVPFPPSLHRIHLPNTTASTSIRTSPIPSDFFWPDPAEVADPTTSSTYANAAQALMQSWYLFQRPGCEMAAAFLWSAQFNDRFYTYLVVEKRQRALVLLYYFCFILSWLSDAGHEYAYGQEQPYKCWWAHGQTKFSESMGLVASMLEERWKRCVTTVVS
ncbi:hypothetical protein L218DRAFT_584128 [Marasmius fiardii PR-910]|nr:hypothetical protein L218DRAFT_584128 [Marasmius fiardii PR-910]